MTERVAILMMTAAVVCTGACRRPAADAPMRASGYVEATEVRIASRVGGRVELVHIVEGASVTGGDVLVTLATTDADLAIRRLQAERAQADAQVRLLMAGSRAEDVRQAQAQVSAATADAGAADAEVSAARVDEARFQQLVEKRAGSAKQRDDAVVRRELADARSKAARDRVQAAAATVERLQSGARPEELAAARARVAVVDAQLASLARDRQDATVRAPASGIVTSRLVEPGEIVAPGTPLGVIVDLEHAWANVYVEESLVPSLHLDQAVTIVTDAGQRLTGRIAAIAPRAEFTPRNVQTSAERAKLVYRVKVATDNRDGTLKPGMPVEMRQ